MDYLYFDGTYPFMRPNIGESIDGNPVSYSSIYAHLLIDEGKHEEARRLLKDLYKEASIYPGYLSRGPHKMHDRQTHDDIVHFVTAAQRAGGLEKEINDIYEFLNKQNWVYYIKKPSDIKTWFQVWIVRIPGFKSVIKYASNRRLSILEKLWLLFDIFWTTREDQSSTSGRLMDWAKYKMLNREKGILGLACRLFERDINNRYKHLMGDVFQIYFQRDPKLKQNAVHLFAVNMQNKI